MDGWGVRGNGAMSVCGQGGVCGGGGWRRGVWGAQQTQRVGGNVSGQAGCERGMGQRVYVGTAVGGEGGGWFVWQYNRPKEWEGTCGCRYRSGS